MTARLAESAALARYSIGGNGTACRVWWLPQMDAAAAAVAFVGGVYEFIFKILLQQWQGWQWRSTFFRYELNILILKKRSKEIPKGEMSDNSRGCMLLLLLLLLIADECRKLEPPIHRSIHLCCSPFWLRNWNWRLINAQVTKVLVFFLPLECPV